MTQSDPRRRAEMKRLLSWLTGALLMAGLMAGLILPASVHADEDLVGKYSGNEIRNIADDKIAARGGKVDLNNSSVRRFQQFPGMYPTMAGKIVLGGPYNDVDDVLNLDLSERQIELFNKYKENFTVTPPEIALNEGDDRINDGQYR